MRTISKVILLSLISFLFVHASIAQKKADKTKITPVQKFKAPKLYTFLTTYKDSVSIPLLIAESIVAAKLQVFDEKKTEYTVTSYQFMYKKRTVTEDEQTGKVSPATSMVSERFTVTPLPGLWINKIREQLKVGEELYFFDVIAKDTQGRVIYASNLKIIIK